MRRSPLGTRMRNAYGEKPADRCERCCNFQTVGRGNAQRVCIAYSPTEPWFADECACGLLNTAFLGLRPKHRPLAELFNKPSAPSTEYSQESLF